MEETFTDASTSTVLQEHQLYVSGNFWLKHTWLFITTNSNAPI